MTSFSYNVSTGVVDTASQDQQTFDVYLGFLVIQAYVCFGKAPIIFLGEVVILLRHFH